MPTTLVELFSYNEDINYHNTRHKYHLRHPIGYRQYMYRNFIIKVVCRLDLE